MLTGIRGEIIPRAFPSSRKEGLDLSFVRDATTTIYVEYHLFKYIDLLTCLLHENGHKN
jgi:hypothetical protein